ncbi:unnamed protein product [Paramecium pentaurelia]|uniref:ERV/ALR sulfhydryl oxidase domain-containing protein n=1 Tax=Paramecium pentaurelia TaxID=43138 RepID=A0A8S1RZE9_9CILI|nr:unnamed protein product [Paramecium pentaurelia]
MEKNYIVLIGVSIFFLILFMVNTFNQYEQVVEQIELEKQPFAIDLMDVKVPSDWDIVKPEKEELENMDEDEIEIINEKKFSSGITREELGRNGWTLLHMISATLPVEFDEKFTFKINVFLNLFGQFYPCKECAGHFLNMTTILPYEGNSRVDFMQYLCMLHNEVNQRLNKTLFNCSIVHERWGGDCGCSSKLEESIKKYSRDQN